MVYYFVADSFLYRLKVRTKGGVQSVTTNITERTSPILDLRATSSGAADYFSDEKLVFWMQLASISYATRVLFLGSAVIQFGASTTFVEDNMQASQASFLNIPVKGYLEDPEYVWSDVLKGIEEMSHNVTAALLTLQLGIMNSECFFDKQSVVYRYTSFALWAPYGVSVSFHTCMLTFSLFPFDHFQTALCVSLVSLVVAVTIIIIMARSNTGNITTSFSDTIILTRHLEEEISAITRLRLRGGKGSKHEYTYR